MRDSGRLLREFDVAYFAASTDAEETNRKFAKSLELDYPILSDPGGEVAKAYGVLRGQRRTAQRCTIYISKEGKVLYVDKKVKARGHGAQVVEKLKELGIARRKR